MAERKIRLAGNLAMPLDAATETFGVFGVKGRGKTHTAAVLTEQFLDTGVPVVVIDPTGVHWGLRSSADGKRPGFPITIVGGDHADVPLEETAGSLLAELVASQRVPLLLDLSHLSKRAMRRFLTDFMETLYLSNRYPLHIVADECDLYAPQRAYAGVERLLGAMEDVVRRGRVRGLGITLISQRPASVNTNVRSQVGTLILLGLTGTHDIKAVDEWVNLHADPETARQVKASLPSLETGTAWVWSPQWLRILQQVKVNRRKTFDSSATPKVGETLIPPAKWAQVDAAALSAEIAATVQRAKENDPDRLRAEIKQLRRRIVELEARREPERVEVLVEVPVVDEALVAQINKQMIEATDAVQQALGTAVQIAQDAAAARAGTLADADSFRPRAERREPEAAQDRRSSPTKTKSQPDQPSMPQARQQQPARRTGPVADSASSKLGRAERRILTALAQHRGTRSKHQVAVITGYAIKGGGFGNALGKLRSTGCITGSDQLTITDAGYAALGEYEHLPTGRALISFWSGQLPKAARLVLEHLAEVYPAAVQRADLADATGYEAAGGGFGNALGKLRTLELITDVVDGDGVKALQASSDLFQEAE